MRWRRPWEGVLKLAPCLLQQQRKAPAAAAGVDGKPASLLAFEGAGQVHGLFEWLLAEFGGGGGEGRGRAAAAVARRVCRRVHPPAAAPGEMSEKLPLLSLTSGIFPPCSLMCSEPACLSWGACSDACSEGASFCIPILMQRMVIMQCRARINGTGHEGFAGSCNGP